LILNIFLKKKPSSLGLSITTTFIYKDLPILESTL